MSEKKMVRRNVAVALGLVCVLLIAGLIGAIVYGVDRIHDRDNAINQLNSTISGQNTTISSLTANNTNLQNIVNLNNYVVWKSNEQIQQVADGLTVLGYTANYTGYVAVQIVSSNAALIHIQLSYAARGLQVGTTDIEGVNLLFSQETDVATGDTAIWPIVASPAFPTVGITIIIGAYGNSPEIENVTITYYY